MKTVIEDDLGLLTCSLPAAEIGTCKVHDALLEYQKNYDKVDPMSVDIDLSECAGCYYRRSI